MAEYVDRRHLSLRDWVMLVGFAAGLIANYVAVSNKIAVIETKVEILMARSGVAAPEK